MPVIDMCVRDHVDKFPCLHTAHLRKHMQQHRILTHIPIICSEHILRTLIQDPVQDQALCPFLPGHIEGHAISAGIQIHLVQILMYIQIRHDPAAVWMILKVIDHPVDLVKHPLLICMLHSHLVTVCFPDRTLFVRPAVPDMALQVMDVVGLPLPDPQHLVRTALDRRPSKRQRREFLRQIVTVHYAEPFDRICHAPVFPLRTYLLSSGIRSVVYNISAHLYEYFIRITHNILLHSLCTISFIGIPARNSLTAQSRAIS